MIFLFFFADDTHLNILRLLDVIPLFCELLNVVIYVRYQFVVIRGHLDCVVMWSHFFEVACLRNIPKLEIRRAAFSATYKLPISLDTDLMSVLVKLNYPISGVIFSWKKQFFFIICFEYAFFHCVMLRPMLLKATSDLYLPFAFYEAFVSRGEWCWSTGGDH